MNIESIKPENADLYDIDLFFKKQYTGKNRYGRMGLFFWKIFKNPFRIGFVNLFKDDGKIIATTSITPKSLLLNQSLISAGEIGDTYTDSHYQGNGLFSKLINFSREQANKDGIKFVYGTPNNQSLPGYKKRANFDIINAFDIRVLKLPLRIETVLRPKLGWFFSFLVDLIFNTLTRLCIALSTLFVKSDKAYSIHERLDIPEDWNGFWHSASANWDFIFAKNSLTMSWRYFKNPEKYVILYVRSSEELVGFCAYRILSDESGTNLVIADFLFLPDHVSALNNCLRIIKSKALDIGAKSVSLWCDSSSPYFTYFRKNGFLNLSNIPLICYKDKIFEKLNSIDKVHFVIADTDNI
tara:strand:+ start:7307 stop:8368 length:1062 start_codon:yes stop_codon:yes gene_type:complete